MANAHDKVHTSRVLDDRGDPQSNAQDSVANTELRSRGWSVNNLCHGTNTYESLRRLNPFVNLVKEIRELLDGIGRGPAIRIELCKTDLSVLGRTSQIMSKLTVRSGTALFSLWPIRDLVFTSTLIVRLVLREESLEQRPQRVGCPHTVLAALARGIQDELHHDDDTFTQSDHVRREDIRDEQRPEGRRRTGTGLVPLGRFQHGLVRRDELQPFGLLELRKSLTQVMHLVRKDLHLRVSVFLSVPGVPLLVDTVEHSLDSSDTGGRSLAHVARGFSDGRHDIGHTDGVFCLGGSVTGTELVKEERLACYAFGWIGACGRDVGGGRRGGSVRVRGVEGA